jgi:uncharacterized cupin superfamily protein
MLRAMKRADISSDPFETDDSDPPGYKAAMLRLGPRLGAKTTGISVYDLPPGEALCPYHYEHGEEEWLLVLSGRATVRHPGGTDELGPHEVAFFPRGKEGAHQVRNDGSEPVRVVMFSDVVIPTATTYPDSDKIGVWTGDKSEDRLLRRTPNLEYYDGEADVR